MFLVGRILGIYNRLVFGIWLYRSWIKLWGSYNRNIKFELRGVWIFNILMVEIGDGFGESEVEENLDEIGIFILVLKV